MRRALAALALAFLGGCAGTGAYFQDAGPPPPPEPRALGLPTRVVNGIVYVPEYGGFLYHSWNEVWIEGAGWRPVDPTFAQPLADATHLAQVEGESAGDLVPLVAMLGRARVAAVGEVVHW